MESRDLTCAEKETLIQKVKEAVDADVLKREDMARILKVCAIAIARRIKEIDDSIGGSVSGKVQ